jgi:hypothetical protein
VGHIRDWIALQGDNWLRELTEIYKIEAVRAEERELVSLKYNAIESPMREPIVQECRGMIVQGYDRNARVVAHPYNKFWNHGEALAATIDWTSARVQSKLDGSLCLLYYCNGWQFGSSGSPLGGGRYNKEASKTFGSIFRETFESTEMVYPNPNWQTVTFCFELVSPDNRIVVPYKERKLILHGARNIWTEKEMSVSALRDIVSNWNWPVVKEYSLSSIEQTLEAAKTLNPVSEDEGEGFVVVDDHFNRVKIKSPRYVALHHLRDRTTPRAMVDLWRAGEISELLTYFPEFRADIERTVEVLEGTAKAAYDAFIQAKPLLDVSRKEFALAVKEHPWGGLCFKMISESDQSLETMRRLLRESSEALTDKLLGI